MKAIKTEMTAAKFHGISKRLETEPMITINHGDRYIRGNRTCFYEIIHEEVIRESPPWKWAAHNMHRSETIYEVRRMWVVMDTIYASPESQWMSRDYENTRWEGETGYEIFRGPFSRRDEAVDSLAAPA